MSAPVTLPAGPTAARLGTLHVCLFPARHEFVPPDNRFDVPWAWGGVLHIKFRIGDAQVSKRVTFRSVMGMDEPSAGEALAALVDLCNDVRRHVARHGINPDTVSPFVEVEAALEPNPRREDRSARRAGLR